MCQVLARPDPAGGRVEHRQPTQDRCRPSVSCTDPSCCSSTSRRPGSTRCCTPIHRLVAEAVAAGATVFLSSHVLSEVEQLADRVGILRRGVLVDIATLDDLRGRAPANTSNSTSTATPPMRQQPSRTSPASSATATGDVIDLVVEGSIDAALKAAATLTVRRLVTLDSDLEDSFLANATYGVATNRDDADRGPLRTTGQLAIRQPRRAAGIVAIVVLTASLWPSIEGSDSFDDLIDDLPDSVKALIGAHGGISLGTPAGYLNARIFATLLPVLLTVYGIGIVGSSHRRQRTRRHAGTQPLLTRCHAVRAASERAVSVAAFLAALGAVALLALLLLGTAVGRRRLSHCSGWPAPVAASPCWRPARRDCLRRSAPPPATPAAPSPPPPPSPSPATSSPDSSPPPTASTGSRHCHHGTGRSTATSSSTAPRRSP